MKLEFPILDINEGTGGDPTSCMGTASLSNSPEKCSGICYPNNANIKVKAKGKQNNQKARGGRNQDSNKDGNKDGNKDRNKALVRKRNKKDKRTFISLWLDWSSSILRSQSIEDDPLRAFKLIDHPNKINIPVSRSR